MYKSVSKSETNLIFNKKYIYLILQVIQAFSLHCNALVPILLPYLKCKIEHIN